MATLDKLLIKGIRSFSPENTAVLQFDTPLTLIVGQNGAGKTTVIEALQYAVTGECPPNSSKGKAFVHDPKVSHDTEVKALIRLQWKTAQDRVVQVVRTLQLTQKDKKKSEFKSLDNVVKYTDQNTGESRSLSKTCADANITVPQMLGVSKAIIENVIFVHQDDANWPLSEGAVLKKKFDDIFAATKYTKALETIRKLKNDLAGELKEKKADHNLFKERAETAANLKQQAARAQDKKQEIEERIRAAQEREQQMDEDLKALHATYQKIRTIADQVKKLEAQRQMLLRANAERKDAIEDTLDGLIDDPLEDAEAIAAEIDQSAFQLQQQLAAEEKALADKRLEIDTLRQSYERRIREQGTLEAEKKQFEAKMAERRRLVGELAERHPTASIPPAGPNASEQQVEAAYAAAQSELRRFKDTLESTARDHAAEDAAATREVDAAAQALAAESEGVKLKRRTLAQDETRHAQVAARLQSPEFSSAADEESMREADQAEARLKRARQKKQDSTAQAELAAKQRELESAQDRFNDFGAQRDQLARSSGLLSTMRTLRQEANTKEHEARSALTRLRPRIEAAAAPLPSSQPGGSQPAEGSQPAALPVGLSQVLGFSQAPATAAGGASATFTQPSATLDVPAPPALREFIEPRLHEATELANKARQEWEQEKNRGVAKSALASRTEASVRNLTQKVQEAQAKLADVVFEEEGSLAALEQQTKEALDAAVKKLAMKESYEEYLKIYEEHAATKRKCAVCLHAFEGDQELQVFQNRLAKRREAIPQVVREAAEELAAVREQAERLQRAKPAMEEVTQAKAQLAAARAEYDNLRAQSQEIAARTTELEDALAQLDARRRELERLHGESKAIEGLLLEAQKLRARAADIEETVRGNAGGAGAADEDQLKSDIVAAEGEIERLRVDIKQRERTARQLEDDVLHAEREFNAAQHRSLTVKMRAQERDQLLREQEDLARRVEEAKRDLQSADARYRQLLAAKEERERARAELRAGHKTVRDEIDGEIRRFQADMDKIDGHIRDINNFKDSGKLAQLDGSIDKMKQSARQREEREQEFLQLEESVRALRDNLDKALAQQRAAGQILQYLRGVEQAKEMQAQVDNLRKDEAALGSETGVAAQINKVTAEKQDVNKVIYEGRGQTSVHAQQHDEARKKLKDPNYKNIEEKFRENALDVRLREGVLQDLEKYYTAVDKALVAFHGKKMEEINKLVRDYWQKTYQGADIDYIMIKSDNEGAATRSYNYRVVMVNPEGAELDMRGRCSAGQKVLACLIIRLALAEAFCHNCGILALDEPTTNLDEANSRSLAESLSEIMKQKRGQSSFQLIVITHDRNFANLIGQREHADFFWQITKDEAQHSKIEKVAIYD